jgi:hypothetical protein
VLEVLGIGGLAVAISIFTLLLTLLLGAIVPGLALVEEPQQVSQGTSSTRNYANLISNSNLDRRYRNPVFWP